MLAIQAAGPGHVGLARLERSDGQKLRRLFFRLSADTVYRRFLSPIQRPEQARPDRLLDLDHRDREAVVAVVDGEIVGVARYMRWPGRPEAELAVVVADAWQRQGVATRMLAALADLALGAGVERFTATMQADNRPVLRLLRRFRPSAALGLEQGLLEATLPVREGLR
ncbi:MAG: GNAT family N-acetyltransferase [Candidatus Dormibacteraeota bacterium]|nr:GNAT family N-acetyltransferase [Candidatus Dormibacteraeota bacterium]